MPKKRKYTKSSTQSKAKQSPESKKANLLVGPAELRNYSLDSEDFGDMAEQKLDKIIDLFKQQNDQIKLLQETVNKVLEENKLLRERVAKLENQKVDQDPMVGYFKFQKEMAERQVKEPNFVIYGLKENPEGRSDLDIVNDIFEQAKADEGCVTNVFRMGKPGGKFPRLVKVQTSSVEQKRLVMSSQRSTLPNVAEFEMHKAVGYSRYLRDDLTQYQRNLHRKLVLERNSRNEKVEEGYRWRIYDLELVKKRVAHLGET